MFLVLVCHCKCREVRGFVFIQGFGFPSTRLSTNRKGRKETLSKLKKLAMNDGLQTTTTPLLYSEKEDKKREKEKICKRLPLRLERNGKKKCRREVKEISLRALSKSS
jgi:hypothetical protein